MLSRNPPPSICTPDHSTCAPNRRLVCPFNRPVHRNTARGSPLNRSVRPARSLESRMRRRASKGCLSRTRIAHAVRTFRAVRRANRWMPVREPARLTTFAPPHETILRAWPRSPHGVRKGCPRRVRAPWRKARAHPLGPWSRKGARATGGRVRNRPTNCRVRPATCADRRRLPRPRSHAEVAMSSSRARRRASVHIAAD